MNTFWDNINAVYSPKSIFVPVFGSGIPRIKNHRGIEVENLLKIMLWTFKGNETRLKYSAKLTIVIHKDKIRKINLFDIFYQKWAINQNFANIDKYRIAILMQKLVEKHSIIYFFPKTINLCIEGRMSQRKWKRFFNACKFYMEKYR